MTRYSTGRPQEGGRLAVHLSDFNQHVSGADFRQKASTVDVSPLITNLTGTNVQDVLQNLKDLVALQGTGAISIGNADGYISDGYIQGDYNVGSAATPTLFDAFNAAFTNPRLQNGGVIFVLAGDYKLTNTVVIPANITIMGEHGGTIISSNTTERSMFKISFHPTGKIGGNSGSGEVGIDVGSPIGKIRLQDLTLVDNFDGYVNSGQPTMTTVPMIAMQVSSNLVCERVSFLGRLHSGTVGGRAKTRSAVGTISGGGTGTSLTLKDCFFDGLKLGVEFAPNNNNLDFLNISGCKARIFGTEDLTGPAGNTFIATSLCNANISNNYLFGIYNVSTFLYITSGTGVGCKMVVSGTTGGGSISNITSSTNIGNLIVNNSGNSFDLSVVGNNFGMNISSPWVITVGGSDSSSTPPCGDFFGVNAMNLIMDLSINYGLKAKVIVNPGIYNINGFSTTEESCRLTIIGNVYEKQYPIFNINMLSGRTCNFAHHVEGIHFISTGTLFSIISLHEFSGFVSNLYTFKNCIFTDVGIATQLPTSDGILDATGRASTFRILVEDCDFTQTGAYGDRVGIALPWANYIKIDRCNFYGNGYAILISNNSGTLPDMFVDIDITNCLFDMVAGTTAVQPITAVSPLGSAVSSYICIDLSFSTFSIGEVKIRNCQIYADESMDPTNDPISAALLSASTFTSFIRIKASKILVDQCLVVGPADVAFGSGTIYSLPTMFLEPYSSAQVLNSRFIAGNLPLQFSGTTLLGDANKDGITVEHCHFSTIGNDICMTLLDIDLSLANPVQFPLISVCNNNFKSNGASSSVNPVKHVNYFAADYQQQGVIQIWAAKCFVKVDGNKVVGDIWADVASINSQHSLLVVNTFNTETDSGTIVGSVSITNNSLAGSNHTSTATSTDSSTDIWVRSSIININNNQLFLDNLTSPSSSFIGNAHIDLQPTNAGNYFEAIITGNLFSRRKGSGAGSIFNGGYIRTEIGSQPGRIFNNRFSDPTYDGTLTTKVLDQGVNGQKWLIENNTNQQSSINLRLQSGLLSVAAPASGSPTFGLAYIEGLYPTNLTVTSAPFADSGGNAMILACAGALTGMTTGNFRFDIPLVNVLPSNVRIISVTCNGVNSINFTNSSSATIFTLILHGSGGSLVDQTDTMDFTSGSGGTKTAKITPNNLLAANTFDNTNSNNLVVSLACVNGLLGSTGITSSGAGTISISPITITYLYR